MLSTGDTKVNGINCKNFNSNASTGDITLRGVVATGKFALKRSTGDIKFYGCDAADVNIQTDTGDIEGEFLSDKIFVTATSTGRIDVPSSMSGGKCEIKTNTGDIKVKIVK